jgi:hypothetical protein
MSLPSSTTSQQLVHLLAMGYLDAEISRETGWSPHQLERAFADACKAYNVADRVELILLLWSSRARAAAAGL